MRVNDRQTIIDLTPLWKGERFPDGRPKVPQKYLDAMQKMTLEELWKPIFVKEFRSVMRWSALLKKSARRSRM